MANLDFITDRLATGGDLRPSPVEAVEDIARWRDLGITHVVDNRLEWSDEELVGATAPEIRYLHNGIDDHGRRMPDAWFDRGVAFIEEALAEEDTKVLVHCHMGINRGPSLAYAAMLALGHEPIRAIDAIRTARPIAGLGYAEDALDWHHRRLDLSPDRRHLQRVRLAHWRQDNWIDVVRIIRTIRYGEAC